MMRKITKSKAMILMAVSMFIIAMSQIASRFITLNDFTKGSFIGVGIGLLLITLVFGDFKSVRK
ncbi:hypothetical protein [Maribacter cobaltidurans]|nr:hypothetical protein [Maribacter cobaltidurans]GGD96571.1 hypothetical protein GCM10011412_38390 [Maribacter cobaltidurans]